MDDGVGVVTPKPKKTPDSLLDLFKDYKSGLGCRSAEIL